jgi:hypothetical protein
VKLFEFVVRVSDFIPHHVQHRFHTTHKAASSTRSTVRLYKMPPKGKKGADKGKSGEEERDEPLQAVVSLQCAQPDRSVLTL